MFPARCWIEAALKEKGGPTCYYKCVPNKVSSGYIVEYNIYNWAWRLHDLVNKIHDEALIAREPWWVVCLVHSLILLKSLSFVKTLFVFNSLLIWSLWFEFTGNRVFLYRMKRASSLNFLNKSTEETTQVLYSSQLRFNSGNSIFWIKYRVQVIVCYLTEYAQRFPTQILTRPDLPAGCQLWTLRQQGAKRQQRGPIQTQLPARLDRIREAESGPRRRGCLQLGLVQLHT